MQPGGTRGGGHLLVVLGGKLSVGKIENRESDGALDFDGFCWMGGRNNQPKVGQNDGKYFREMTRRAMIIGEAAAASCGPSNYWTNINKTKFDSNKNYVTEEKQNEINKEKEKIDLLKAPVNLVERAIQTQYRIMIENTVNEIKNGLSNASKSVHSDQPVDMIIAGGTSSPPGFDDIFRDTIMQAKLSIKIGDVIRPNEPLYSVAKGCLIAAEAAYKS